MIGTAFGLCIALQNFGMFLSPLVAGATLKTEKNDGYYWTLWYFAALALVCTLINIWVYIDDKKFRAGALDKVEKRPEHSEATEKRTSVTNSKIDDMSRDLIAEGIYSNQHQSTPYVWDSSHKGSGEI